MLEGVDYSFIVPDDPKEAMNIKLLSGPYVDTIYRYGKLKVMEHDDGTIRLVFAYYVISSPVAKPKKLEKDKNFRDYIGPLLVQIVTMEETEQEYINELGTDNSEESDLR